MPQPISFNLAECSDSAIAEAVKKLIRHERERVGVPAPRKNKGRANRNKAGLSFHAIEALDVWRHLPRKEAGLTRALDDSRNEGSKRRAAREASSLHQEWRAGHTADVHIPPD